MHFSAEVDAFAALVADDSLTFVAREFFRRQFDFHPLISKEVGVRDFAVGQHLLLIFVSDLRMHLASQCLRRFLRGDADRLAAVDVYKCRGDFSPIAEFQGALAQAAAGDDGDGVGGAAVDFDEGDEALPVFSARIVDSEFLQAEHRETDAQHLSGTKVAVSLFGVAEIFVERKHGKGRQLSAVSFQLNIAASFPAPADAIFRDFD